MMVSAADDAARFVFLLVLAFLAGVVFGVLGTAAHQATIVVAGVTLPGGTLLAIAGVATLYSGFRLEFRNRLVPLASAMGLVLTVGLFSLKSVGGSVLVPNNLAGIVWSIAPAVLAIIVVCWPRLAGNRPA